MSALEAVAALDAACVAAVAATGAEDAVGAARPVTPLCALLLLSLNNPELPVSALGLGVRDGGATASAVPSSSGLLLPQVAAFACGTMQRENARAIDEFDRWVKSLQFRYSKLCVHV